MKTADIQEGKKAPDFSLPATTGENIRLSDYQGKKNVVLYFYPKDNTPGCTQESCDFRDTLPKIKRKDTEVLGISPDPLKSHENFKSKYRLNFPLLSDEKREVVRLYGVWKEKSLYGRKYMGVERSTFVIDKKGILRKIFSKVKVTGHAEEVLDILSSPQLF